MHIHSDLLIALAGQPNCGKSSLFEALTGVHQEIGNHAGITVEKKSAHYHDGERRIEVVDLPGMYSLNSTSPEERVARDFILLERPEAIVVVVDASNLRRHMSLLLQILEMQHPTIVCLNMIDVAQRRGIVIDVDKLSKILGVPVVQTVNSTHQGIEDVKAAIRDIATKCNHESTGWKMDYDSHLEFWIGELAAELSQRPHLMEDFYPRWLAIKLMEKDRYARRIIQHHTHDDRWEEILNFYEHLINIYEKEHGQSPLQSMVCSRWQKAAEIDRLCVTRLKKPGTAKSDRIDRIACHPLGGLAVAAIILLVTFELTFQLADGWNWVPFGSEWTTPVGAMEYVTQDFLPHALANLFHPGVGDESLEAFKNTTLGSLCLDGILAGVGSVLVFLPVIFTMFTFLAILELSGYISRVSLVMDKILRRFGLCGQSMLPLVLSGGIIGGCAVPAVYATRTMDNFRQRLITMLVAPFMTCGGKVPVLVLLTGAFFTAYQGLVFGLLIFSTWIFALLAAWILSRFVFRGEELPLLLELPPYQIPTFRGVMKKALAQSWDFLAKAGTIILAANVILWAAMYYPAVDEQTAKEQKLSDLEASYAGQIGGALTPVSQLAGFDAKDNVALIGGVAAKEIIISSLATAHQMEMDENIDEAQINAVENPESDKEQSALIQCLKKDPNWSMAKTLAFLLFVMLYSPCAATLAVMWRETGTIKWPVFSFLFNSVVAFTVAVLVYQIGRLI